MRPAVLILGLLVEAALALEMADVAGLRTFPTLPLFLGQARHLRPVEIVIGATETYETVDQ